MPHTVTPSHFLSHGIDCAGKLFLPDNIERPPVVVMGHGLGAQQDFRLPAFAERFAERGLAVFTFDYRDVGLTLRLTPQINSSNYVKMDIFSKLEALVPTAIGTSELAPTTLKRQANTTVVVKDGHTVVIGGMIRDDKVENVSSVPFFGSLPLIGPLFRSTSTRSEKNNLLIFLTPHVIASSQQLQGVARDRMEDFRQFPDGGKGESKGHQEFPEEVKKRMNLGEAETDMPAGSGEQE